MSTELFQEVFQSYLKLNIFTTSEVSSLLAEFNQRYKVGNLRKGHVLPMGYKPIYFGRPTIYQNPIRLMRESDRLRVLVSYEEYLDKRIKTDHEFNRAMCDLIERAIKDKQVVLTCWCYPKECHATAFLKKLQCLLEEVLL